MQKEMAKGKGIHLIRYRIPSKEDGKGRSLPDHSPLFSRSHAICRNLYSTRIRCQLSATPAMAHYITLTSVPAPYSSLWALRVRVRGGVCYEDWTLVRRTRYAA